MTSTPSSVASSSPSPTSPSTSAPGKRARGEAKVANRIDKHAGRGVVGLHDRRIPDSRANIDHIAVTARGVFVIDAKKYRGRLEIRRGGGEGATLWIDGRARTTLAAAVRRQVDVVRSALAETPYPDLAVEGILAFTGVEWPLSLGLRRTPTVAGCKIVDLDRLEGQLKADGPIGPATARLVAETLAAALPSA